MTNEKSLELARDIRDTILDETYLSIARDTESIIARQLELAANEVVAAIAWESFADGCDAYDVPLTREVFAEYFPVYSELV